MRRVGIEEYEKLRDEFFEKFNEFTSKLCEINREESAIPESEYNKDIESQYELRRAKLKAQYSDSNSIYGTNFYTILTKDTIEHFKDDLGSNYKYFEKDIELLGRMVQDHCRYEKYGVLMEVALCVDDVYFVVRNEDTGREWWISACSGIEPYNPRLHQKHQGYKMVTNGRDYL